MAAPSNFVRSLLRLATVEGRNALVSLSTSQWQLVKGQGGRQLTGGGANGKSFSYTIPQGLSTFDLIGHAEEALTIWDQIGELEVARFLATRPPSRTVSRPCGCYGPGQFYPNC